MLGHRGQHVLLLAGATDADTDARLQRRGVAHALVELAGDAPRTLADRRTIAALARRMRAASVHAVVSWGGKTAALGAIAARRAGVARSLVLTTGWPEAVGKDLPLSWQWRWLLRPALKAAHAIIVTASEERAIIRAAGFDPDLGPIIGLPCASVDLERHRALPLPAGPLTLLALCGNVRSEGAALVEALSRVPGPRPRVVLFGPRLDPPDGLSDAECAAAGLEVAAPDADATALLAACHAVIDLSPAPGNVVAIVRALAAGRPVLTTDVAGNRSTVDVKISGVLVPPGDAIALAAAIAGFARHPDLLPSMSRAARSKAERLFDTRQVDATLIGELGIT
jgi:hypothetical protein